MIALKVTRSYAGFRIMNVFLAFHHLGTIENGDKIQPFAVTVCYMFRLYEVKDERHAEAFFKSVSLAKENSLTMGERAAALQQRVQRSGLPDGVKVGPGGSREVSFVSRSSAKYVDSDSDGGGQQQKRRGVQPLGLKPDHHRFGGQGRGMGGRGGGRGMGGRGGGRGMGGRGGRGGGRGGRRGGGRR